ncbi:hypothetical protein BC938DRAFT_478834 [Jimgerdemannia flammicorona]|uniref:Uncharacterized protein n=1 Tax=Jimgerdemannia flammicorona TaxID=994334 RepID=A0A433QM68_9FUNG|nr:hypothetical protein BC938DRAFT_478834 [Jimgerdemannia flammicorona]
MIGPLNGGSINSSSSGGSDPALAVAALSSNVQVAKRSYPGKSAELVRATALLPGTYDERTDLEDWRCMFESAGVRRECMLRFLSLSVGVLMVPNHSLTIYCVRHSRHKRG